jgi:uncharacterized membrane protein YraQ (UPF0718 family)
MISRASSSIAGVLRLVSRVVCLIVIASFLVFVVDQTGSASVHQQNELSGGSATAPSASSPKHKSTLHRTLDETSDTLTSPFAVVVSGSHSQWTIHLVRTALALFVYGFCGGYLARVLRVRV